MDPFAIECCSPSDGSKPGCKAIEGSTVCSPIFSEGKHLTMTYCPMISDATCGGSQILYATEDLGIFGLAGMHIEPRETLWKSHKVNVCWFQIKGMDLTATHSTFWIYFKVNRI